MMGKQPMAKATAPSTAGPKAQRGAIKRPASAIKTTTRKGILSMSTDDTPSQPVHDAAAQRVHDAAAAQRFHDPAAAQRGEEAAAKASAVAAAELPAGGNIDKIRDIIFGNQMRDYEKRFGRLEDRLLKESSELRDELKRRFEQLEAYTRTEFEAIADQLKNEQGERGSAAQALTQELRDLGRTTDKRAAQLDEQAVKNARDLRQQLLDQAKQLSEELRLRVDNLAATLDREAQALRDDKTDRAALAALFTEMAMRLTDELTLPGE